MNKLFLLLSLLLLLGGCNVSKEVPLDVSHAAAGSGEASYALPRADPPFSAGTAQERSSPAASEASQRVAPKPSPAAEASSRAEESIPEQSAAGEDTVSIPEPWDEDSQSGGTNLNRTANYFASQDEPPVGYGSYQSFAEGSADGIDAAEFEEELFRLINSERETAGKPALGMEDSLRWAARMRAPEVLQSLSHTRPDGTAYYTAFDEAGFAYAGKWHGENVSSMQFPTGMYAAREAAAYMFGQLSASSGHLNNMLSDHYDQVGIGVFVQQDGDTTRIGSAQMFAGW